MPVVSDDEEEEESSEESEEEEAPRQEPEEEEKKGKFSLMDRHLLRKPAYNSSFLFDTRSRDFFFVCASPRQNLEQEGVEAPRG